MAEQPRSRVFLWVLLGGGAFFLFLVAIFALVYFTLRSQQKATFSGFGDKIAPRIGGAYDVLNNGKLKV